MVSCQSTDQLDLDATITALCKALHNLRSVNQLNKSVDLWGIQRGIEAGVSGKITINYDLFRMMAVRSKMLSTFCDNSEAMFLNI